MEGLKRLLNITVDAHIDTRLYSLMVHLLDNVKYNLDLFGRFEIWMRRRLKHLACTNKK